MQKLHSYFICTYALLVLAAFVFGFVVNPEPQKMPHTSDYDSFFRWMFIVIFAVAAIRIADSIARYSRRYASKLISVIMPSIEAAVLAVFGWFTMKSMFVPDGLLLTAADAVALRSSLYPRFLLAIFCMELIWHGVCYYRLEKQNSIYIVK